eukprot:TRINITY_DN2510_c0_g1_i10.p2 TRINITY_DN2510_c0_g1~~TRINITY_DN2510_c0_g1_i10.p2  ORF type:complete len:598 (-),score=172.49 TRINITY_DN2510_c0_g1_i10:293-2086(-)
MGDQLDKEEESFHQFIEHLGVAQSVRGITLNQDDLIKSESEGKKEENNLNSSIENNQSPSSHPLFSISLIENEKKEEGREDNNNNNKNREDENKLKSTSTPPVVRRATIGTIGGPRLSSSNDGITRAGRRLAVEFRTQRSGSTSISSPLAPLQAETSPQLLNHSTQAIENNGENDQKRSNIVKEIVDTEIKYVESLGIVVYTFMEGFLQSKLVEETTCNSLFGGHKILLGHHKRFLATLQSCFSKWSPIQTIGDLFCDETNFMLEYKTTINNFNYVTDLLKKLKKEDPNIGKLITKIESNPECKFKSLEDFLIEPVQRIPRYELLLKSLFSKTSPTHKDFEFLKVALKKLGLISKYLNNQKMNEDNIHFIQESLDSTSFDLSKLSLGTRTFIYQGKVNLLSKKKLKVSHIFLLNSLLIVTNEKERKRTGLPLDNVPSSNVAEKETMFCIKKVYQDVPFRIVHVHGSEEERARILSEPNRTRSPVETPSSRLRASSLLSSRNSIQKTPFDDYVLVDFPKKQIIFCAQLPPKQARNSFNVLNSPPSTSRGIQSAPNSPPNPLFSEPTIHDENAKWCVAFNDSFKLMVPRKLSMNVSPVS